MFRRHSPANFTASRVLHIVRDPVQAIFSYFQLETSGQHNRTVPITQNASAIEAEWSHYAASHPRKWQAHCQFWLDWATTRTQKDYLRVTYEELVATPAETLSRILRWVELPVDAYEARVSCAVESSFGPRIEGGYRPSNRSSAASYDAFSAEQLCKLYKDAFKCTTLAGYEPKIRSLLDEQCLSRA